MDDVRTNNNQCAYKDRRAQKYHASACRKPYRPIAFWFFFKYWFVGNLVFDHHSSGESQIVPWNNQRSAQDEVRAPESTSGRCERRAGVYPARSVALSLSKCRSVGA